MRGQQQPTAPLSTRQVRTALRCLEDWDHVGRIRDRLRARIERLRAAVVALGFEPYPTAAE